MECSTPAGGSKLTMYTGTEGVNGLVYWDREGKLTSYTGTERVNWLVLLGQSTHTGRNDKWTGYSWV